MSTVGICEDDAALRGVLRNALEREDFDVTVTATGTDAVRVFSANPPDVLVLDIGLPDSDGRDVCRALRARGVDAPVIFLTALDALPDRLSGFHAGGDDYLTKPFALSELAVRVQALSRRTSDAQSGRRTFDLGEVLDPAAHSIQGDPPVALTPTEYRLLATVCSAHGAVVRRQQLVRAGWPEGAMVSDNTLDAYVSRIRTKLRRANRAEELMNVRGIGYQLK
ncbi:MAG: response regulator transcription factor [Mycobacteriales bacterium]